MKKLIVLLIAFTSFTAAFSQKGYNQDHSRGYKNQENVYKKTSDQYHDRNGWQNRDYQNKHAINERERQMEMDRVNRDYDRRIDSYRHDRSLNRREREQRIRMAEAQRNEKMRSFGTGAIIGAVAGIIIGSLAAH